MSPVRLSAAAAIVFTWMLAFRPAPAAAQVSAAAGGAVQAPWATRLAPSDGGQWRELELPVGFGGSVTALGTLVTFRTSTHVHLWSAITKEWAAVAVAPSASYTQFNDYAIILDGNRVHGYATRTGVVETLTLPAAPTLHHGSITSCWVSFARLGAEVYGFAAFDGHWAHRTLASASPTIAISQVTGLLHDGVDAYGFSAYFGTFQPIAMPGAPTVQVQGEVGIVRSASSIAGFSAHTNTWTAHDSSGAVQLVHERGYAMYASGAEVLAYSACTGQFASYTAASAGFALTPQRYVAALAVGDEVTCYSAGTNTFDTRSFSSPVITGHDEILVVSDALGVTGFSCVTGTYSSRVDGQYSLTLREAVAWIADGAAGHAYSPLQNAWSQAPILGDGVSVLRNVVVVRLGNVYFGFSGRTGEWALTASSSPSTFAAPTTGDLFLGLDGNRLLVFDPILVRWAETSAGAPAQSYDIWRQTAVAFDGAVAHGYGFVSNVWDEIATQGAFQSLDANDSCGYVLTSTHLYTYGAHGSLATISRWPEFSRFQPLGAPLGLVQVAPPSSAVILSASLGAGYQPAGPLGTYFLDPAQIVATQPLGVVPASGVLDVALALPKVAELHGVALHLQDLVTPPSGSSWLTCAVAPVLF